MEKVLIILIFILIPFRVFLKTLDRKEEVSKQVRISSVVFFSSLKLNTRQIISPRKLESAIASNFLQCYEKFVC